MATTRKPSTEMKPKLIRIGHTLVDAETGTAASYIDGSIRFVPKKINNNRSSYIV